MQFKQPELLYALFALLIPIIVHLFQLRKFKKQPFTNVAFLKKIKFETRKSSQLKKWLTLLTRMLLLACIIFAFAQPYYAKKGTFQTKKETVIYLDNSYSMQAKGDKGELLKRAVQDLLEQGDASEQLSLLTNDQTFKNVTIKGVQKELLDLGYTSNQLEKDAVLLKLKKLLSQENTIKDVIWISDFQQKEKPFSLESDSTLNVHLVQLKPEKTNNLSIDSLYIEDKTASEMELVVIVNGAMESPIPVSLFNGDTLIGKTTIAKEQNPVTARFTLPNNNGLNGVVTLDDNHLEFDNTFYFSINKNKKINVLSINAISDDFLKKIYTEEEFNFTGSTLEQLNYSSLENQNLIILNELQQLPISLTNALRVFTENGGNLVIIPGNDIDMESYNALTSLFQINYSSKSRNERKITTINFSHPIYSNVFNKQVTNFQYPNVSEFYAMTSPHSNPLQFEDGRPFLTSGENIFVFSAAIDSENSNFKLSPLIVPTLYNIGKQSLKIPNLYYTTGQPNEFDVTVELKQDNILTLSKDGKDIIPQQQYFNNKVKVKTNESPTESGIYAVKDKGTVLEYVSFNDSRSESQLIYNDLSQIKSATVSNSLNQTLEDIKSNSKVNELWKWFVIFALIFLVLEILILKFFK